MDDAEGLLQRATLAVFALVAGADGTVDASEVRAFVAGAREQLADTAVIGRAVWDALAGDGDDAIRRVIARSREDNLHDIQLAGFALDARLGTMAISEKLALLSLGRRVADASDGVDRSESNALDLIEVALGLAGA